MAVASVDCRSAFAPTRPPHNSRPRDGARPRRGARSRPPRRRRRSPLEPARAEGRGVAIRARGGGEEPGLKQSQLGTHFPNPPRRHTSWRGTERARSSPTASGSSSSTTTPCAFAWWRRCSSGANSNVRARLPCRLPFHPRDGGGQGTGLSRTTSRPGAPARPGPPRPLARATPGAPRPPPRRSTPTPRRAFPPVARVERAPRRVLRRARSRDGRAAHVCPRRRRDERPEPPGFTNPARSPIYIYLPARSPIFICLEKC